MTVITKPLTLEKKNLLKEPTVDNAEFRAADVEAATATPKYIILGARARRITTSTTLCLFITALLVMSVGVIGGVYAYRQFTRQQFQRFNGWCNIPIGVSKYIGTKDYGVWNHGGGFSSDDRQLQQQQEALLGDDPNLKRRRAFRQMFELDLENESFEKIEVPDFGKGRKGRFVHDFQTNKTGIIDLRDRRCFIMPLNRRRVYPPKALSDLFREMMEGFYLVDTEVVRETMEVVLPPIHDFKDIGEFIEDECKSMRTYMLKKRDDGIKKKKRSASPTEEEPIFTQFAGKKISEVQIDTTLADEYERSHASKP